MYETVFQLFIHCNHDQSLCWNNNGIKPIKLQILLVIFSKNRSLVIFPFFMIVALKVSRINLCLLKKKKKSSWGSYLISIRADNPVPIWQKHCSPSNKTIRKGLERKCQSWPCDYTSQFMLPLHLFLSSYHLIYVYTRET